MHILTLVCTLIGRYYFTPMPKGIKMAVRFPYNHNYQHYDIRIRPRQYRQADL